MSGRPTKTLTLEEAGAYLLERARSRGVQLEVYASRDANTSVQANGGAVEEFKFSLSMGVGLRVLQDASWGYAYTENLSPEALDLALENAIENASLVAPTGHAVLGAWAEPPHVGDLYGEGLSGVTVDRKVRAAIELEGAARGADPRVVTVAYNFYQDGESDVRVANTAGLDRSSKQNYAFQFVWPVVHENGQNKSKFDWAFSREFEMLDPTRTAISSVQKSLALLGAKPAPSGAFPAVIEGRCMAQLLGTFASAFSAKMVQEGKSPLSSKLGQAVAGAGVTVVDDATRPAGLASRPFDAEGFPSAPLVLLDRGVLGHFLHNTETAAQEGVESTGHAARMGYKGTVGVAPSNLFVEPGRGTQAELVAGLERGLLLTDVSGTHAGANPYTGDFSLQAEGFWVEGGEVQHPLEVFTVAGNFLELLAGIEALADNLTFAEPSGQGAFGSPSVRVAAIAVGGQ